MARSHLQNRVMPTGEIVAASFRGAFTGNRGILKFDAHGGLCTSRWKHKHWIVCNLQHPRGRYHGPQPVRGWTPLFFLDEAVALAAGHRPCAYCRPEAYRAWIDAWTKAFGAPFGHKEIDAKLHAARVTRTRTQIRHQAMLNDLPNYTFLSLRGQSFLVLDQSLYPFIQDGYGAPIDRDHLNNNEVTVLTPQPTLGVLASGYKPETQLKHSE